MGRGLGRGDGIQEAEAGHQDPLEWARRRVPPDGFDFHGAGLRERRMEYRRLRRGIRIPLEWARRGVPPDGFVSWAGLERGGWNTGG